MTPRQLVFSIKKSIAQGSAAGILLVLMAGAALLLANSPFASLYESLLSMPLEIRIGELNLAKPLLFWINDGLMAIFFFLVGLEVKREVLTGHLSTRSQVVLPGIAAIAGIVTPALIYYWFNRHESIAIQGWAIPSATDIAFALGIFSLFGSRLSLSLKLFLLSVAIFDDLGAIFIIAIFYSSEQSFLSLVVAGTGLMLLFGLNRFSVRSQAAYLIIGVIVWVSVLKSGVHATLAGFAVAWFIPLKLENLYGHPMLPHLEQSLNPWVSFVILPLFAFANAGVSLTGVSMNTLLNPVPFGIAAGLFIGKQVGIFGACWLAIKLGLARLPDRTTWLQFYAVTVLCGIGFTMSLFIGSLAFEAQGVSYMSEVKLGVLVGSLCSAIVGSVLIAISQPRKETMSQEETMD